MAFLLRKWTSLLAYKEKITEGSSPFRPVIEAEQNCLSSHHFLSFSSYISLSPSLSLKRWHWLHHCSPAVNNWCLREAESIGYQYCSEPHRANVQFGKSVTKCGKERSEMCVLHHLIKLSIRLWCMSSIEREIEKSFRGAFSIFPQYLYTDFHFCNTIIKIAYTVWWPFLEIVIKLYHGIWWNLYYFLLVLKIPLNFCYSAKTYIFKYC